MGTPARTILTLSLSSTASRFSFSHIPKSYKPISPLYLKRVYLGFRPLCSFTTTDKNPSINEAIEPLKHSILLEKLRIRHLKDNTKTPLLRSGGESEGSKFGKKGGENGGKVLNFEELGLSEEVLGALGEMGISVPTEIQCIGVPAVIEGKSVVLGSHTGSGKTLAYMLPISQLLRRDEALYGMLMKPRRPRAVVLCPTRELSEQVFRVAKSVSHHARFRCTMVSGGGRLRPQEDSLNGPIDMVVGTPGRVLQHIEEGNIVYGDIKYVVLDEADTMFDRGFGPDIRKFLGPLKNRASKPGGLEFQTVLVTATMTQAVQKLVEEEFQGIVHVRTSTLHKKIALARHDFIKLSGAENKLEALLQVLEPSLAKGNRVMVFCNTLNSSRAVDHFLSENQVSTVNYHGEVPAEQRVENLKKFKSDDGDCPTLVCTDLAARGLDLDVDHVIMFDFPLTSIDYLHRTGRTARMGAKGKVTSLVAKKDHNLATIIEEAIMKNESLESLTVDYIKRDTARSKISQNTVKSSKLMKVSSRGTKAASGRSASVNGKVGSTRTAGSNSGKDSSAHKSKRGATKVSRPLKSSNASNARGPVSGGKKQSSGFKVSKPLKSSSVSSNRGPASGGKTQTGGAKSGAVKSTSKLNVVGFRGRSSSSNKNGPFRAS
ncbi:RNA helicase, DEAD-box type, Q motif protein [Heracleum sosnowskyi]|uniref:RNA helicase, DEAD-box type, Q motif protein n=1 Tax=Heracleum sosnowskyi TaxID=360622 RepID=A0AAD8MDC6_9APIA|nr:RNA helicase, DEAD-box type, Q motif protein [Heracleum sosnowskyi]